MNAFFTAYLDLPLVDAFELAVRDAEQGNALEICKGGERVAVLIGVADFKMLSEALDRLSS